MIKRVRNALKKLIARRADAKRVRLSDHRVMAQAMKCTRDLAHTKMALCGAPQARELATAPVAAAGPHTEHGDAFDAVLEGKAQRVVGKVLGTVVAVSQPWAKC